jgi:shikimate dehydrogenase
VKEIEAKEFHNVADLRTWPGSDQTRLGVFGYPVAHSLSPVMQNAALTAAGIKMRYASFEIEPEELSEALKLTKELGFAGLNLTVPHKVAAAALMDELDPNAREIGAVNTVKFSNGRAAGFDTDGKGFVRAVREVFAIDVRNLRVLVLGAGGAARAIASQCGKEHCERLVIANRSFDRARELADQLRQFFAGPKVLGPVPRLQAIPWEENALRFQLGHVDLVVNATALGLNRNDRSPIPARLLEPHLMVYDVIYANDSATPLISAAREVGARCADGRSMLLHQGALAFEIWFGREAPLEAMRRALVPH